MALNGARERESVRVYSTRMIVGVRKRSRKFHLNRAGVYRSPAELATIVNKVHVLLGSELRSLLNYGRVIRGVYPGLLCHDDIAKRRRITANPRISLSLFNQPASRQLHEIYAQTRANDFARLASHREKPPPLLNALPPSILLLFVAESKKGSSRLFSRPRSSVACFFSRFLCRSSFRGSPGSLSILVFCLFCGRKGFWISVLFCRSFWNCGIFSFETKRWNFIVIYYVS